MPTSVTEQRSPNLFVLSGLHEGAALPLAAGTQYRVGRDIAGDIVLRDDGIHTHHVTLNVNDGMVKLVSHGDQVQIDRDIQIPDGHVCEARLPLCFTVGAVRMRIAHDRDEIRRPFRWPSSPTRVFLPVVCGMFFVLSYMLGYPVGNASETATQTTWTEVSEPVRKPPAALAQQQLIERLATAGLGHLKVQAVQGQFEVSGELSDHGQPQWHDIQTWFDQAYGRDYMLRSRLTQGQEARLAIRAVWTGDSPYLIDGKGLRRYPGFITEDGWKLEKIGRSEVVLAKNGQQHIFRL